MRKSLLVAVTFVVSGALGACATLSTGATMGEGKQEAVWVCHGNRNPRWQRVAAPAADAHQRHRDMVSRTPQEEGAPCGG